MRYRANDLHSSETGVAGWQMQQSANNSALYHQAKSQAKHIKLWKQKRSIQMKQDYQNSQSRTNYRSLNLMDEFDEIAYEKMLKNKARQFVIKIRRQKQQYYGKLLSGKINQENSKTVQSQQASDKEIYQKSIRQERRRLLEQKRVKRLSQLKLPNILVNDAQPNQPQQNVYKSPEPLSRQKKIRTQKLPKNKVLQTIPEDKSKAPRVTSINRSNKGKILKTEPPTEQHDQIDRFHQMKSLPPKRVSLSASNDYYQSRVRLPQSKLLLTNKDRQQLEEINNKMSLLIKLNNKK